MNHDADELYPELQPAQLADTFGLEPGALTQYLKRFVNEERMQKFETVLSGRTSQLRVLLDNVYDPHNVSACMRSCEALGIQHIHLVPQPEADLRFSRDVAIGAEKWITIHIHESVTEAIRELKALNFRLLHTKLAQGVRAASLPDVPYEGPLCVIFGSEQLGVSEEAVNSADGGLLIPMYGFSQSLNISVAVALTMYDLRQKQIQFAGTPGDLSPEDYAQLLDSWIASHVPRAAIVLEELVRRDRID